VIRDSGRDRARTPGWLNERRLTVSHQSTSIRAACMGLGYAWYSADGIREELDSGRLKPLPLREGAERWATLYLIFADRDVAGPGARRIAELIVAKVAEHCPETYAGPPRPSEQEDLDPPAGEPVDVAGLQNSRKASPTSEGSP
jgi:DNA-binding transcriptional LysR family regulator